MEDGRGKVKEEMGGAEQDMTRDGGRERMKGTEREERGYSPKTSIPGAATEHVQCSSSRRCGCLFTFGLLPPWSV